MQYIGQLKELRTLLIDNDSAITNAGLQKLTNLKNLEILQMTGTKVTGEGFDWTSNMPVLRNLRVQHTKFADGGVLH